MKKGFWGLLCFSYFFFSIVCWAYPVPDSIQKFLISKNRTDLLQRFLDIPQVSAEPFVDWFSAVEVKLAGAGYNGAAFRDSSGKLVKVSHSVFSSRTSIREFWKTFYSLSLIENLSLPVHKELDLDKPLNPQGNVKELMGTLLWSIYEPTAVEHYPDIISADSLAYRRKFVQGVPLSDVIKEDALNLKPAVRKHHFNMPKVWKRVAEIFRQAENMLFDSGVMVDIVNSSNFIVSGDYENPIIELVDHEFVRPTPEGIAYYAKKGIQIPHHDHVCDYHFVEWPVMPEHVVFSMLWTLSFEQAVGFMQALHNTKDRNEAIQILARVPEWKITLVPGRENYSSIHMAKKYCDQLLSKKLN